MDYLILLSTLLWCCVGARGHEIGEYVDDWTLATQRRIKAAAAEREGVVEEQHSPLLEGDTVLPDEGTAQKLLDDILRPPRHDRTKRTIYNFATSPTKKWPQGRVYYEYEDGDFTTEQKNAIERAMRMWDTYSCIAFVPHGGVRSTPRIKFEKGTGCISFTGKGESELSGRAQPVILTDACVAEPGEVAHILGHAIGLWHEHDRPDRHEHVRLLTSNVQPGEVGNFPQIPARFVSTFSHPYDHGSITHFHQYKYAAGAQPTLLPLDGLYNLTLGQRVRPSFWDLAKVNRAYCEGSCKGRPLARQCTNNGYQDPVDCERCLCPDSFGGDYCEELAPSVGAECGGVIGLNGGPIIIPTSKDGREGYGAFVECSWLIQAKKGAKVQVTFEGDFNVYCHENDVAYHWVEVRYKDDLTATGPRFCGKSAPDVALVSSTHQVRVIFASNYEPRDKSATGSFTMRTQVYGQVCYPGLCHNGGSCEERGGEYYCMCALGYDGARCENALECGGCDGLASGQTQPACMTSAVDRRKTRCSRVTTRVTYHGWWIFKWKRVVKHTEWYPCEKALRVPVCCAGAKLHYKYGSATPLCGAVGWAEWGACSAYCGACGHATRPRYKLVNVTASGMEWGVVRPAGAESCPCGMTPCQGCLDISGRGRSGRRPSALQRCLLDLDCCEGYKLSPNKDLCEPN